MQIGDRVRVKTGQNNLLSIAGTGEGIVVAHGRNSTISVEMCESGDVVSGYLVDRWELVKLATPTKVYAFQEGIMIEEPAMSCYVPFSELRTLSHKFINGKIGITEELYPLVLALSKIIH